MNKKILYVFATIFLILPFFVKAAPAAITNLNCVLAGSEGDVWLTWTPPADTNSYDVRYWPGFFYPSDYNSTMQYSQNWAGTAKEGMVSNLTTNTTWFFAMKAIDAGDHYSGISNIISCFVPMFSVQIDKIAPTSSIIDPQTGATILPDKTYIIKGDSSDTGGSAVKQVEISFDEGKNWSKAGAKETNKNSGFLWQFTWTNPAKGDYQIITRATDWIGNIETPGNGIKVRVASQETPVIEKPISEMSVIELKAKIVEIQQQIIQILTQLIQLTQSQIRQFKLVSP